MSDGNSEDRIDALLDANSGRDKCPVAGEIKRLTRCTCLRDLITNKRAELRLALITFLRELENRKTPESRTNHIGRHLYDDAAMCHTKTRNDAFNKHYMLPMPVPTGGRSESAFVLCRSAMLELTRGYLVWDWKEAEAHFISRAALSQNKKREVVMKVLKYLLLKNFDSETNIDWRDALFTRLGIRTDTAKKYVRMYSLRKVVSECVRCVPIHQQWVEESLHGRVVRLDMGQWKKEFSATADRSTVHANYQSVDLQSVGRTSSLRPKVVQYRKVDAASTMDKAAHKFVQGCLKPQIAAVLSSHTDEVIVEAAFLRSLGLAVQLPHFDFNQENLSKLRNKIFIGITPLTDSGSFLQVWEHTSGRAGEVLYIPLGILLLLPADTVHGGGFQSCADTMDLRLHFYVYVNTPGGIRNQNIYLSLEDYPQNPALHPSGILHRIFACNEEQPRANQQRKRK